MLVGPNPQVLEHFEVYGSHGEAEVGINFDTYVGTFNTLGGVGNGGTVTGLAGDTGTSLALRQGNTFGRENTTTGGHWYLDSNDTYGIGWFVNTGALFDRVVFNLIDGSDSGAWLSVLADGERVEQRTGAREPDGGVTTVVVQYDQPVVSAFISIANFAAAGSTTPVLNDGFAIDDISVNIAPVPLPASVLFLLAALGGLYALRRAQGETAPIA